MAEESNCIDRVPELPRRMEVRGQGIQTWKIQTFLWDEVVSHIWKETLSYQETKFQRRADQKSQGWGVPAVFFLLVWPWPVPQSFRVSLLIYQGRNLQQLLGFSQLQINRHMSQWATWEKDPNKQTQQLTLEERNNSWKSESEVARSCPTLCDPVDCSPPGSSVHGIFQARILEWVAISFSRGSSQPRDRTQVSRIAGRHLNLWATRQAGLITHGLKQIKK